MRNYQFTERAQNDIDEILEYIGERQQNRHGAQVVLDYLHAAMQDVAKDPKQGIYRRDLTSAPVKFYRKGKEHKYYLIFDQVAKPIRILRVASVHRDFVRLLERERKTQLPERSCTNKSVKIVTMRLQQLV